MPDGTGPAKLVSERSRWVSSVSCSKPTAGSCDKLKSLPERLRSLSEVKLNSAGSRPPAACRSRPPRSSLVTRPSVPPQLTPSQRQQSVPGIHDWKVVESPPVLLKESFSRRSDEACSSRQGTGELLLAITASVV
ncbi:hypothetical protein U9M48_034563 [Paspalum notatum var. saurae]|uniref:Uncharacterized protein n=1 Tax=Paspalum notatum var. saurae TaxID=547442 RepID=A0AAQ3X825_PASNO